VKDEADVQSVQHFLP